MLATSTAPPLGDEIKPAVWPSAKGEAYLIPTWLMQEQRLAQAQINQPSGLAVEFCSREWCAGMQVSLLAAQLQRNAQEDYRVYHRIAAAARRGVRPTVLHQMCQAVGHQPSVLNHVSPLGCPSPVVQSRMACHRQGAATKIMGCHADQVLQLCVHTTYHQITVNILCDLL